jgi:tRNA/tmRNA/rRNA uracil-C5-methylase (TrmA/RlmC/RlmD family)
VLTADVTLSPVALPVCPHRPPCPGCPRYGQSLATHAALAPDAALASFAREHGVTLELPLAGPSHALGHRLRARLAVRGRSPHPRVGIFERGSHHVVDMPECRIHHPSINDVAQTLREVLAHTATTLYAERSHHGLVRYAQLVVERGAQRQHARVQVVVVGNCEDAQALAPLFDALVSALGDRLHGLFFNSNTGRGNAIFGPRTELIAGLSAIEETIAGARVFFPPDAFGQQNLDAYEALVERIGALVPDGADVLELYAGVGAIGLSVLSRVRHLRLNELSQGSLRGLRQGLVALPELLRGRTQVLEGAAGEHAAVLHTLGSPSIVIADPPRKGLDAAVLQALCHAPPERFVYLSCNQKTFLRDAQALLARGALSLRVLRAEDFFPFGEHVELLAVFER